MALEAEYRTKMVKTIHLLLYNLYSGAFPIAFMASGVLGLSGVVASKSFFIA